MSSCTHHTVHHRSSSSAFVANYHPADHIICRRHLAATLAPSLAPPAPPPEPSQNVAAMLERLLQREQQRADAADRELNSLRLSHRETELKLAAAVEKNVTSS